MARNSVSGLAEAFSTFDRVPDAAREQLAVELGMIGYDIRAQQIRDVAKDTGYLSSQLSVWLMVEQLKVRVGLIGLRNRKTKKRSFGDAYYGRFVEFGRSAQTVLVQRRRRVTVNIGGGETRSTLLLSRRRKRAEDISATYSMKVKARAPDPFILRNRAGLDAQVAARLADFWSQTLERAGS